MTVSRRTLIAAGLVAGAASSRPTLAQAGPPAPWGATPSPRQLAWHRHEQYAFIHFTINTFTDREWGYGDEDPALFDPTDFDPDQIIAAARSANMRGVILTAKHHDGFCLWPTMLTEHCIRHSPYKGGKGDIVGEIAAAARRAGLMFGVYLSPWDRNHGEYGRPAYIDYFRRQIVELCTRYGELFEFWFDGANGGDGYYGGARETRRIDAAAYYDWPSLIALVHRYQPMACTFDPPGSDIRWVGNEDGVAGDPCWPTMPDAPYTRANGNTGVRGGALWWPTEANTSIRPGWFYHADEDGRVRSPDNLVRYYDTSVARGTNMHLNLPPDRRGRIAAPDVASLKSFGDAIRASFAMDLARGAIAHASAERGPAFAAAKVLDGKRDSYWSTPDGVTTPSLTLDLLPGRPFDLIRIREHLPLGVRVTRFAVDADDGGGWRELAVHDGIGAQRIIRLDAPVAARRLRLRIIDAPACPAISEIALFRAVAPVAVPGLGTGDPTLLPTARWHIVTASAPGAEALIDGDDRTAWLVPAPAGVTIDLGREQAIAGFTLTPLRPAIDDAAPPRTYIAETSRDGVTWRPGGGGELPNIAYALATQRLSFPKLQTVRYLRLRFTDTAVPAARLAIGGIGAFAPTR